MPTEALIVVSTPRRSIVVRGRRARVLGAAEGFGDEQLVSFAEREAEGRRSIGILHAGITRQPMPADLEGHDLVRRLLGHHERVAVRRERDLRGIGAGAAERPVGSVEGTQTTVSPEREAGDAVASCIEHVDEATMLGDAHRRMPPLG